VIDADVHVAPASIKTLQPFLGDYWNEYVATAGVRLLGMPTAYPPKAPTTGGPTPATYDVLRERVLDVFRPEIAILNCLTAFEAHRNPHYQAALASALNDWVRTEFLDRDERLRASIAVSTVDPDDAATEVERVDDPRFVQVLLPVRADAPYGNKRYHRLHAVAAERGLVLGLHAWGRLGQATTSTGYTLSYVEDYLGNPIVVQQHVLSLVSEGVFERFPDLRVALLECGFTWLPSLLWRFDKDWKGIWREVPWVKELPSIYVRRHFRATTAPAHLPAEPRHAQELLASIGPELLLHASDYPHDHGGADALYAALDDAEAESVRSRNAASLYRL
jgi:predicted TIM-barrel fold metal-dependent hydrolase